MPQPTVVIFDVNETLSDLAPLADRFEAVGAPPGLLEAWFAGTLRDGIALAASGGYAPFLEVGREVLIYELARLPRLSHPPSEAADHILAGLATLSVHPDVADGLRLLDAAGIRIATLTNGSAELAQGLLERAGLDGLVERNLDVTEVKRWKPAPEPYLYACDQLDVTPGDATLVAVHPWDVHGAIRAGLQGAWLDRASVPYPAVFAQPSTSAHDLLSLARGLIR